MQTNQAKAKPGPGAAQRQPRLPLYVTPASGPPFIPSSAGVHVHCPPSPPSDPWGQSSGHSHGATCVFRSGRASSHVASLSCFQPIQKLKGKPQKAFDRPAADLLALWPSRGWGAPHRTRAPVGAAACVPPQPAPLTPRHHPSAAVPAPPTQAGPSGRRGRASAAGDPGNHVTVSASFPPTPRVLPTPGVPTVGALPSTSFPTSPAAKEPRGDV